MKSVLISIQPKWCELIANGKKTVEVRKTKPKIDVPFKVYIYCTQQKVNGEILLTFNKKVEGRNRGFRNEGDIPLAGKVIGEFVCAEIEEVYQCNSGWIEENACISQDDFFDYLGIPRETHLGYDKKAYAWHISDLEIYDIPKELSEFLTEGDCTCENCRKCKYFDRGNGYNVEDDCLLPYQYLETGKTLKPLFRPPQSWCYVEELK